MATVILLQPAFPISVAPLSGNKGNVPPSSHVVVFPPTPAHVLVAPSPEASAVAVPSTPAASTVVVPPPLPATPVVVPSPPASILVASSRPPQAKTGTESTGKADGAAEGLCDSFGR